MSSVFNKAIASIGGGGAKKLGRGASRKKPAGGGMDTSSDSRKSKGKKKTTVGKKKGGKNNTTVVVAKSKSELKGLAAGKARGKKANLKQKLMELEGRFQYRLQVSNPGGGDVETVASTLAAAIREKCEFINKRSSKNSIFLTLPPTAERAAYALKRLDGKVAINGHAVSIKLEKLASKSAGIQIPPAVLSPRYNVDAKFMNLSALLQDPLMAQFQTPGGLSNHAMANAIIDVIKKNCPDLITLDLSNNDITNLSAWRKLGSVAGNLINLSLENNKINSFEELNHLRSCRTVQTLMLGGNPALNTLNDRVTYEKRILKHLKGVQSLDGVPVSSPAPTGSVGPNKFVTSILLPPELSNVVPSEEIRQGCLDFLRQYFTVFDSEKRESLHTVYAETAQFTLHVPSVGIGKSNLAKYNLYSKKKAKSIKFTKTGPVDITSALKRLPKTTHQSAEDLAMNVFRADEAAIGFAVSGRYQELRPNAAPYYRAFRRTFELTPSVPGSVQASQGWSVTIQSDKMEVANDAAFGRELQNGGAPPPPAATMAAASVVAPTAAGVPDQQALIVQLQAQTGMNPAFTTQCLESNNWDLAAAFANFQELQAAGSLPAEAFA
eukprot:TRINITY_DN12381_c0_g1_i1.p2 TRINITY_DN12381_c0_g1~~TRINITY_DN12381_c0_g1_i1.p2  ORF type:complete len:626 (+),score=119.83 TRINITY_DN12381_c0_g1_i1:55-1878(+)